MAANFRRNISIDFTKCGTQNTSNYPLYVHIVDNSLKTTANNGHVQNSSGNDITFWADPFQGTKLNWEVENYVATTGTLDVWIKIPTLSATQNTNIWMFYGDSTISTFQGGATGTTWDSNYLGVWHWGNSGSLSMSDSTTNANTGTNTNTATLGTGIADGGLALASASSQYIDYSGVPTSFKNNNTAVTVEAWFNSSTAANQVITCVQDAGTSTAWFLRLNSTGVIQVFSSDALGALSFATSGVYNDGNWHYIAMTVDGVSLNIYVDNVNILNKPAIGWKGTFSEYSIGTSKFRFGARGAAADTFFNGTLDECRVSGIARSTSYITAVYNNINSPSTFSALQYEVGLTAYSYSRSITVAHTLVSNTDQTNFPLLVKLTDNTLKTTGNGGHVQSSSGYDIVFSTGPNSVNLLSSEIDYYDGTNGVVWAWVLLPKFSSQTDTTIYILYGNSNINQPQGNPTNIWSTASYGCVYHLGTPSTLGLTDSTSNANTLTNNATVTAAAGQIGGCGVFAAASSQYLSATLISAVQPAALTSSFWFNTSDANATNRTPRRVGNFGYLNVLNNVQKMRAQVFDNGSNTITHDTTGTVNDGAWHYYVCVFDATSSVTGAEQTYLDGAAQGGATNAISTGGIHYTNVCNFIGADSGPTNYFTGNIDEVRTASVKRSADWILTEYNNQSNPGGSLTLGSEFNPVDCLEIDDAATFRTGIKVSNTVYHIGGI